MEASSPILIYRLSSLGDVILATAALDAIPAGTTADWVVAKEYEWLLIGHPRIRRIWTFDRKRDGLREWLRLNLELAGMGYSQVFDLHLSLRTRVARWVWVLAPILRFFFKAAAASIVADDAKRLAQSDLSAQWKRISKQRLRLFGFYLFKGAWPRSFRPSPIVERVSLLVSGHGGRGRPDLRHLAMRPSNAVEEVSAELKRLGQSRFVCVMPSSLWPGKRWPTRNFADSVQASGIAAVVLGAKTDQASHDLAEELMRRGLPTISGVGRWNLAETAAVLALAEACLGNDTGMAHLAEAVGTRAITVFGPTAPEMGFGPWRDASRSIGADLWCRPCGKDGRACIRPIRRQLCLQRVPIDQVVQALREGETLGTAQAPQTGQANQARFAAQKTSEGEP